MMDAVLKQHVYPFLLVLGVASFGVYMVIREGKKSFDDSGVEEWAVGTDTDPGWLTRYYMYRSGNAQNLGVNLGPLGSVPAGSVWDWDPLGLMGGGSRWGIFG